MAGVRVSNKSAYFWRLQSDTANHRSSSGHVAAGRYLWAISTHRERATDGM